MKVVEIKKLEEHFDELFRLVVEEGEIIEIKQDDEVIARLVPAQDKRKQQP